MERFNLSHPVRCKEVPIPRDVYTYANDHCWGEPDLAHVAQLMQQVAERRLRIACNPDASDPSHDAAVLANYRRRFAFPEIGAVNRERSKANFQEKHL